MERLNAEALLESFEEGFDLGAALSDAVEALLQIDTQAFDGVKPTCALDQCLCAIGEDPPLSILIGLIGSHWPPLKSNKPPPPARARGKA